jgi:hypothetical protein
MRSMAATFSSTSRSFSRWVKGETRKGNHTRTVTLDLKQTDTSRGVDGKQKHSSRPHPTHTASHLQKILHKARLLAQLQLGLLQLTQGTLQLTLVSLHLCRAHKEGGREEG